MGAYAVDTVTPEEKHEMKQVLEDMGRSHPVSVDEIVDQEDIPFEHKQQVVSVLHALLHEGEVSHNVNREYYLTG